MREPKFAKFPGGACPQSPLEARAFGANNYSLFSIIWGWNLCFQVISEHPYRLVALTLCGGLEPVYELAG